MAPSTASPSASSRTREGSSRADPARSLALAASCTRKAPRMDAAKKAGREPSGEVLEAVAERRKDYEHQLDARYAGARGFIDAIVYPEETRAVLAMALRTALHNAGPHLGAFVLPPHLSEA